MGVSFMQSVIYSDKIMTKINISIPKPCHENWDAMSSQGKDKFCDSCQKKVIDFTSASDREIVTAFQQNKNLCGRFLDSQLNRDLTKPEKKNPVWLSVASTILSFIGLGIQQSSAQQNTVQTEQTDKSYYLGKPAIPKSENNDTKGGFAATNQEIEVSGIISDNSGPLPGAMVTVKGTTITAQSDFDGKYSLKAKENDTLIFDFPGYAIKEVMVTQNNAKDLRVEFRTPPMGEVIVLKYERKRTFFGRIFHAIGNLFR
ncbi:MAG: carboxypeptidase-like regulatory domain-containing protein [Flavobacterium sp.]